MSTANPNAVTPVPVPPSLSALPATSLETTPLEPLKLTDDEQRKWSDTQAMMVWKAPGFRYIFNRLLTTTHNAKGTDCQAVPTRDVDVAATDGENIMINPDRFFKFNIHERVFVTAHEVSHNMLDDVNFLHRCVMSGTVPQPDGKALPFDNDTMQRAMDARINKMLIDSKIGKPPKEGIYDASLTGEESVLDIYGKYYKKKFPPGQPGNDKPSPNGNNPGGFDKVMKPGQSTGKNPAKAMAARNPDKWAVEIAAAQAATQKMQGDIPGALRRMFQQILEPEVSWIDHIVTLINRVCGDGGYDWNTPDPWWGALDIYSPSPTGRGAGTIVCWGDTSGSRGDTEIASSMAELAGILSDVNPQRLIVLWCDAAVDYVDEIEDPMDLERIQARGAGGGGGTSVHPVFDWIKKQMIDVDLFIGFTDGYVTFPKEPSYPVIWCNSTAGKTYPYGQVVQVLQKGRHP